MGWRKLRLGGAPSNNAMKIAMSPILPGVDQQEVVTAVPGQQGEPALLRFPKNERITRPFWQELQDVKCSIPLTAKLLGEITPDSFVQQQISHSS